MFKKLTLAAGFGAGYVLGAKAGKERYSQLEAKFREIAGMPAVQNATESVKEAASGMAETAKATVNDKVESASDKSSSSSSSSTVNLDRDPAPMAGASASMTAPDIGRP